MSGEGSEIVLIGVLEWIHDRLEDRFGRTCLDSHVLTQAGVLRLYNPKANQWSVNYANLRNGLLTAPVFGSFDGRGRGTFFGQDTLDGRTILTRFIITETSPKEAHFEQAFSADGGQTWEDNWIAVATRR